MYAEGEKDNTLYLEKVKVYKGHQADVREKIEDLLENKVGFFVSLQESYDEGYYQVYLHTDNEEDLEEEDVETLTSIGLGIYQDRDEQTKKIYQLLNIHVE